MESGSTALLDLVDDTPRVVAEGFTFVEGPVWTNGRLIFSDIIGDRMHSWAPDAGVRTLREPNGMGNGQTLDHEGRLLTCEHATSRVVRHDRAGVTVLAQRFGGQELNSPNDVVVDSMGRVLFTDPIYGRTAPMGVPREPELALRGVYELDGDELRLVDGAMTSPNGLCFSPDESVLYVAETEHYLIRRFRRARDAWVDEGVWARTVDDEPVGPDGLRCDEHGNVWCAAAGGVQVFDPDGRLLGRVPVPEVTANLTWGDPDGRTLYICASTSVYAVRTTVRGARRPSA